MADTRILDADQVRRTVRRLAYEIVERNRGSENVVLLGIRDRGARLSAHLTLELEAIEGRPVSSSALDVTSFRDDRDPGTEPVWDADTADLSLTDRDVVLVDDVLFTGRTVRAALDAVIRYGRPRTIQLAVLVDRGHREYPIKADYVGRVVPTKHTERVVVELGEADGSGMSVDIVY